MLRKNEKMKMKKSSQQKKAVKLKITTKKTRFFEIFVANFQQQVANFFTKKATLFCSNINIY